MSRTTRGNWLVAYDIADPHRLVRVHRYLKRHGIPVQYSVFVLRANQIMLEHVLDGIADRISVHADDVRAYHLPSRCQIAMLGRQCLPEGVALTGKGLDSLLRELAVDSGDSAWKGIDENNEVDPDEVNSTPDQEPWKPPV